MSIYGTHATQSALDTAAAALEAAIAAQVDPTELSAAVGAATAPLEAAIALLPDQTALDAAVGALETAIAAQVDSAELAAAISAATEPLETAIGLLPVEYSELFEVALTAADFPAYEISPGVSFPLHQLPTPRSTTRHLTILINEGDFPAYSGASIRLSDAPFSGTIYVVNGASQDVGIGNSAGLGLDPASPNIMAMITAPAQSETEARYVASPTGVDGVWGAVVYARAASVITEPLLPYIASQSGAIAAGPLSAAMLLPACALCIGVAGAALLRVPALTRLVAASDAALTVTATIRSVAAAEITHTLSATIAANSIASDGDVQWTLLTGSPGWTEGFIPINELSSVTFSAAYTGTPAQLVDGLAIAMYVNAESGMPTYVRVQPHALY